MEPDELLTRRLAIIHRIVTGCDDPGKTKVQKIAYFLQEAVGVCLMYPFRMHYYGPYSSELDDNLSLSQALGFIEIKPDPEGFGYHVIPIEGSGEPDSGWLEGLDYTDAGAIDAAIKTLGPLPVFRLELYATIHFVGGRNSGLSKVKTVETVGRLKPKFSPDEIETSFDRLKVANLI